MKTKENMKLVTVGRLMKELSKFERKCADYDVVCWAEDDNTCCIVGHTLDILLAIVILTLHSNKNDNK